MGKGVILTLLTDSRYVDRNEDSQYIKNIFEEDDLVVEALAQRGFQVNRVAWDDPEYDWTYSDFAIFRTTWDYFDRIDEFQAWFKVTKNKLKFINPPDLIDWNISKLYLKDLDEAGINVLDMVLVDHENPLSLKEAMDLKGWDEIVVKPIIAASARHTYKINQKNRVEFEELFADLVRAETMIVQEFQKSVPREGEVALMYFDGNYSHAVLKKAKPGDFRVQDDFGGTVHEYYTSKDQIALGLDALKTSKTMPVYGRVDIIKDNSGQWAVTELELIEPELWFRNKPESAEMFASAIERYVDSSSSNR